MLRCQNPPRGCGYRSALDAMVADVRPVTAIRGRARSPVGPRGPRTVPAPLLLLASLMVWIGGGNLEAAWGEQPSQSENKPGGADTTKTVATTDAPATTEPALPWPIHYSQQAARLGQARYIVPLVSMLERAAEARADAELHGLWVDLTSTRLVFAQREREAAELNMEMLEIAAAMQPGALPMQADLTDDALEGHVAQPAVEWVLEAARDRQVVMFNEEHRTSAQRAFMHEVLAGLRRLGFTHLALETLSEDHATLAARGYPSLDSGFYTQDPIFGDLVRRALELGFTLVPYEASHESMRPRAEDRSPIDRDNRREREQARNLMERTVALDPTARVVVFAGRGHIAEQAAGAWTPMASIFRAESGIDPLTINLMSWNDLPNERWEAPLYRLALRQQRVQHTAVVLVGPDGAVQSPIPGVYDAGVLLPVYEEVHARPRWLAMSGLRHPMQIEIPAEAPIEAPYLVQAFFEGEDDDAVPADQWLVLTAEEHSAGVTLMLRPGRYRLEVRNRQGEVVWRSEAEIGAAGSRRVASTGK